MFGTSIYREAASAEIAGVVAMHLHQVLKLSEIY